MEIQIGSYFCSATSSVSIVTWYFILSGILVFIFLSVIYCLVGIALQNTLVMYDPDHYFGELVSRTATLISPTAFKNVFMI